MSHPEYFSRRAAKYRELAGKLTDSKRVDDLHDIAKLFDHMADCMRNHDVGLAHEIRRDIIKALRGALARRSGGGNLSQNNPARRGSSNVCW